MTDFLNSKKSDRLTDSDRYVYRNRSEMFKQSYQCNKFTERLDLKIRIIMYNNLLELM